MTPMLKDFLDWNRIMKAEGRSAGGHSEILDCLFKDSVVLASHIDDDYQGKTGYVYIVHNFINFAKIVVVSDYFGSCSGCDVWEDASDEDIRDLCIQLANNAHMFDSINEAIEFLDHIAKNKPSEYYDLCSLAEPLNIELKVAKL